MFSSFYQFYSILFSKNIFFLKAPLFSTFNFLIVSNSSIETFLESNIAYITSTISASSSTLLSSKYSFISSFNFLFNSLMYSSSFNTFAIGLQLSFLIISGILSLTNLLYTFSKTIPLLYIFISYIITFKFFC